MWNLLAYSRTGKNHEDLHMECQDKVFYTSKENVQVIALADGAGMDDYAAKGAETTAETAAQFLAESFDELYEISKADVQYNIIIRIRRELYKICEQYHIRLEQVQSTLLAAAIDCKNKRYMALHLGDGIICVEVNGQKQIASYPENGSSRFETKLTSMIPVSESIRVYRGNLEDITGIFLLSDGWRELTKLDHSVDLFENYLVNPYMDIKSRDDISAISLSE